MLVEIIFYLHDSNYFCYCFTSLLFIVWY